MNDSTSHNRNTDTIILGRPFVCGSRVTMPVPHACSIPYPVLGCIILTKCPVFVSPYSVKAQKPPTPRQEGDLLKVPIPSYTINRHL